MHIKCKYEDYPLLTFVHFFLMKAARPIGFSAQASNRVLKTKILPEEIFLSYFSPRCCKHPETFHFPQRPSPMSDNTSGNRPLANEMSKRFPRLPQKYSCSNIINSNSNYISDLAPSHVQKVQVYYGRRK